MIVKSPFTLLSFVSERVSVLCEYLTLSYKQVHLYPLNTSLPVFKQTSHSNCLIGHEVDTHRLAEVVVRQRVAPQLALRHERLVAALHLAFILPVRLVDALDVHIQVAVPHERLAAVLVRTHEPLLVLVVTANVHLQPAVRRVPFLAARVRALEPLRITTTTHTYLGIARVDPLVLAEVLRVVEGLATVRERAHEFLPSGVVVDVEVRVQI